MFRLFLLLILTNLTFIVLFHELRLFALIVGIKVIVNIDEGLEVVHFYRLVAVTIYVLFHEGIHLQWIFSV